MGHFLGSIYCWFFEEFYGLPLADYLWGISSPYQTGNMYFGIGLSMMAISLVVTMIFYYIINHPKLNNWWGWGIFLFFNAVVNFFVGWQWVLKDYYAGKLVTINPETNLEEALPIQETDLLCFGVSNMLLSIIFFFIISLIIKWWSSSCPKAPF